VRPGAFRKLSLSHWSFGVLVVRFDDANVYTQNWPSKSEAIAELFLDVDSEDQPTFLTVTERIEFSGGSELVEKRFRAEVAKREKVGLNEFERRIALLIVFVGEDGTERRLLEK